MADVRAEKVVFPDSPRRSGGYLAQPDDDLARPGVVVLQEWWGIDDHIEDLTRRFAREGYVALAPDLYHGRVTGDPQEARQLSQSLGVDDGAADVLAAISYLRAQARVAPKKVGLIGFCMGGSYVLEAATRSADLAAVAPFYGSRTAQFVDRVDRISAPMFAAFGGDDASIPPDVVERFRQALVRAGKQAEVKVYPGAPHAFLNDQRPSYRAEAAQDAWSRALALFREHLR